MRVATWLRRPVTSVFLVFVTASGARAQMGGEPFPVGTPESEGISAARLGAAMDSVRAWIAGDGILGAVVLVVRHGKVVFHQAAGSSDRERGLPMRTDHIVSMRSMTKPLVGTAALMLMEEGRLGLEDSVSRWLPSFDTERAREITIFQLLTHTSGLTGEIYTDSGGTPFRSLREAVDSVGRIGPTLPPGTRYSYSDPGTSTLGAVIAEAAGMPAEDFIRRRILEPLDMRDSFLLLPLDDPKRARVAATYRREDGVWVRYWDNTQPMIVPYFRASGGLWSTSLDYARFMQMMLRQGRAGSKRLLDSATVALAVQPHTAYVYTPDQLAGMTRFYGLHWSVTSDRYRAVGLPFSGPAFDHGGSDGTHAWADPARDLIVIYLTQSRGQDTSNALLRLIYAAVDAGAPGAR
jgi:CubicO group peptidase (beta-lactamase class C family)